MRSNEVIPDTSPVAYVVDSYGDHSSSCARVSGSHRTTQWHDRLVRALFFIIRSTGVRCGTEVNGLVVGSGKRPDAVVYPGAGSEEIWLDVRTCTPTSPTNCKRSATAPGHAARMGDAAKDVAWVDLATAQGARIIPLCSETFGRMGDPALAFLRTLANIAGACPIEQSAFIRLNLARLHIASMTGVASFLRKNAVFASGPVLLPLAISAPLRRPAAAPLVLNTAPSLLRQSRARTEGSWVNAFLAGREPRGAAPTPLPFVIGPEPDQAHVEALSFVSIEPRSNASAVP